MAKLNQRQLSFVQEYLVCGNATKAAKKAGYSQKTAYSQGQRMLKNVEVKKALELVRRKTAERNEITIDNQLDYAKGIRKRALGDKNYNVELTANDQVNKIIGAYAPTKHEVTLSFEEALGRI